MSRSGYSDDCDGWDLIRWRGAVVSAVRGKRGQALLKEMLTALDAMPHKALYPDELVTPSGQYCALGVLGAARGLDLAALDPEDTHAVAERFGVSNALVKEIVFINDEYATSFNPEMRFHVVRDWVKRQIKGATE